VMKKMIKIEDIIIWYRPTAILKHHVSQCRECDRQKDERTEPVVTGRMPFLSPKQQRERLKTKGLDSVTDRQWTLQLLHFQASRDKINLLNTFISQSEERQTGTEDVKTLTLLRLAKHRVRLPVLLIQSTLSCSYHDYSQKLSCTNCRHNKQESWAIAKITARCALYMHGCPENFWESLTTPMATFLKIFNGLLFRLSL